MRTICLCGSARYETGFKRAMKELGLLGFTVIGLSSYPSENGDEKGWYDAAQKEMLDLVHLNKILLADAVLVINADEVGGRLPSIREGEALVMRHSPGHIGFSTSREILWATLQRKTIVSLTDSYDWKDLAALLTNYMDDHVLTRIKADAMLSLRQLAGQEVVTNQVEESTLQLLHAALSSIMWSNLDGVAKSQFAEHMISQAAIEPMDEHDAERICGETVSGGIPVERPLDQYSHADGSRECRPVEPTASDERREDPTEEELAGPALSSGCDEVATQE